MEKSFKNKTEAQLLTESYMKLSNLQKVAVANMNLAAIDIDAVAFEVYKPAFSLKRIYQDMKPVNKDNVRMVLSALDDWGLVSDEDWNKLIKEYR